MLRDFSESHNITIYGKGEGELLFTGGLMGILQFCIGRWQIWDFPDGGTNCKEGARTYYLVNFSRKLHRNERNWTGEDGISLPYPPSPRIRQCRLDCVRCTKSHICTSVRGGTSRVSFSYKRKVHTHTHTHTHTHNAFGLLADAWNMTLGLHGDVRELGNKNWNCDNFKYAAWKFE